MRLIENADEAQKIVDDALAAPDTVIDDHVPADRVVLLYR